VSVIGCPEERPRPRAPLPFLRLNDGRPYVGKVAVITGGNSGIGNRSRTGSRWRKGCDIRGETNTLGPQRFIAGEVFAMQVDVLP